ncbi:MAG: sulfur carrier protein ThiS [Ruminococcus sp.]|nr:sulfur carrier protein ThiS [Ruminococcus sp.]MDE6849413.1 sulfur carrier protein ThiS [Ruminococcus sp.]MDE7138792.1 sulfur carrier protein ThiS [Ruminococcus sp.]
MITVNGEKLDFSGTVTELLVVLGYGEKRVAVELNENILPKAEYENTSVSDGDKLEIVRFVGGG